MSLLDSICKAQESTVCGICNDSSILKWICIECDLYLCQDCYVKFHSRSKTLEHHLVIDIKEYGTEKMLDKILKVKLREIDCEGSEHCDQKCSLFCLNCNKLICSGCMIKHHKKHDLDELTGFFEQKLSELKDIKVKSEINISVLKTEMQELEVQLSKGNKEFNETKKQILLNKEELMDLIHKHFDNLLKDGKAQWYLTRRAISGEIKLIKGNIQQMEDQKKQFDQILNPHKISEILLSNLSTLPKYSPPNTVQQMSLQRAKFIPGLISKHKGTTQHFQYSGRLHKGPNYKMIRSYKTNNSDVSKIVHLQNGFAILANYREELIQKVKFESDEIEVEIEIKTKVFDIAIMPDGEFLLSMKTSDLGLINANKDKDIFHCFSSFLTFGVYLYKDEIFVGVAKYIEESNKYEDGKIVVLDMKGQEKCTFLKDVKSEKQLFTCPTRIVAYSDIICVVDILEIDENNPLHSCGRIVAINQKGEKKWSYSHKVGATHNLFCPQDITVTPAGLILVSDYWDNAIHAINEEGNVTGWVEVQDIGYPKFPMSLHVDVQQNLWVGCGQKEYYQEEKTHTIYSFKLS